MPMFDTRDAGGLKKMDTGPGIKLDKPPQIPVKSAKKDDAFDFMGHLDSMAAAARAQQAGHATLAISALDVGKGFVDLREVVPDEPDLLKRAKALILQEEFRDALEVLGQLLAASAGHHEARYLVAYCRMGLTEPEEALEALLPLQDARVETTLATRIEALRQRIRMLMFLPLLLENMLLVRSGQHHRAAQRLQHVVALDPGNSMCQFMLAGTLMQAEEFDDARKAAEAALESCPPDQRDQIVGLRQEIERRYLLRAMAPARDLYRHGRFADARTRLHRIDAAYHQAPLFVTFDRYLASLGGPSGFFSRFSRGRSVGDVAPTGAFKDVDALHFFLVREEITAIKEHVEGERHDRAEAVGREALRHAPTFPYANFLCAAATYARIGSAINGDRAPDPAEALRDMERAQACARIGATDREIDEAPMLLEAIDKAVAMLRKVVGQRDAMLVEAKPINAAVEEYQSIMKAAEGGIKSPAQVKQLHQRMSKLKTDVAALKKHARSEAGKEAVKQLGEAVARHYAQLDKIKAELGDADLVKPHIEAFTKMMQARKKKGPITSYGELAEVVAEVMRQKQQVDATRARVHGDDARKMLDDLSERLDTILTSLRS